MTIRIAFDALHVSASIDLQVELEAEILVHILTFIGRDVCGLKAYQQDYQSYQPREPPLVLLGLDQGNHVLEICLLQTQVRLVATIKLMRDIKYN